MRWKPIYIAPDPSTSLVASTVQHPIALPASHDEQASPLPRIDLTADGYAGFWNQFKPTKPIAEAGETPSPNVSTSRTDDGREGNAGSPNTWFHGCSPGMSGRPLDHDANVQLQAVSPSTSTRTLDEQEATIPSDRSASSQETSLGVDLALPPSESTPILTPSLARKRRRRGRHDVPRPRPLSAEPPDSVLPRKTVRSGLSLALPRSPDVFESQPSSIASESAASTTLLTPCLPFDSSEHTQSVSFPESDEYLDPDAHDLIDEEVRPEASSSSLERQLEILGLRSRLWELWCP